MRAALLTTYASASINEDPTGRGHTPFVCFGAAFLYMFAIVIVANVAIPGVSYAIFDVSTGFDFFREFMAIVIEVISLFFNDKPKFMTWSDLPYYLAFVALWLWTFSLQAAAGVLMFLRRREIHEVAREEAREKPIMSPEEARNLWKSRMPARHR